MDQATVQARISYGLAKAAAVIGNGYQLFRPDGPLDPLSPKNLIGTLFCGFDHSSDLSFSSPVPPQHPFVLLLANPDQLETGDYMIGADTYFVSRILPLQPAWCVLCNVTLDVLDTSQATAAGTNAYGGVTQANNTLIARNWPMSMLAKTRGEGDTTKLPSDTRTAFYEVLLPFIPGLSLDRGLCLRDVNAQIYTVMNTETTGYGHRLVVGVATT